MTTLEQLRRQLDEVDDQIVVLYEKRMSLCRDVGELKASSGKAVLDEKREKEKLDLVSSKVQDPNNAEGIRELYKKLMELSRKSQEEIIKNM